MRKERESLTEDYRETERVSLSGDYRDPQRECVLEDYRIERERESTEKKWENVSGDCREKERV